MTGYGILAPYPPTAGGLATFSASLLKQLGAPGSGDRAGVVRVMDTAPTGFHPEVVAHLVNGSPRGPATAAAALNRFDVAIVQHEYDIYGGRDGQDVLDVLADVQVPSIVVLHTIPRTPSTSQRQILERIVDRCAATVVMSQTADRRLQNGYLVDPAKIVVIPHGALGRRGVGPTPTITPFTTPGLQPARPTILTWGLIGPGKGIEWGLDALAALEDLDACPRYLVAGQTLPKALDRAGETYRAALRARAAALGVSRLVDFDPDHRNAEALMAMVRQADVVLLPYDSDEQVASGVLTEAIVAGRPVVATRFPHAVELLSGGAGILVPHRDPAAIATAIRRILTEPRLAASMTARAADIAPAFTWTAVADQYRKLVGELIQARTPAVA
jgi:glycosyltransferase involved in cell wall biosynthesis